MAKKKSSEKPSVSASTSDGVTVRMFLQGLGDCFLLSFPQKGQRDYHVWIDFGVAMGTANAEKVMTGVLEEIKRLTGGVVDLLVITHEHWDHVSGFVQADEKAFEGLEVMKLWFAWTENPKDEVAKALKKEYGKAKTALARAMSSKSGLGKAVKAGLSGIQAFYGPGDFLVPGMKAGAAKPGTGDGMKKARELVKSGDKGVVCLMPGEIRPFPGAAKETLAGGVKAFVLGPPHDLAKVRKEDNAKETYHKKGHGAFGAVPWNWVACLNVGGGGPSVSEALPFEEKLGMKLKEAKKTAFFARHYFSPPRKAAAEEKAAHARRRIDEDWMDRGTQQLALALTSYQNNISLVLAFELPETKKVLLFVGDAQVGNWLSWHDLALKRSKEEVVTAKDLLAQTVLYKVGHHGSHNATLRQKGLEMMTHPELVAMLPVDAKRATSLGYGEMPLESLQKAIKETADERLLRLDRPWTGTHVPGKWQNLNKPKLQAAAGVSYMEYVVRDD